MCLEIKKLQNPFNTESILQQERKTTKSPENNDLLKRFGRLLFLKTLLNGEKNAELEYNLYRWDRPVTGKPSEGVMIGIKKSLDSELVCTGKIAER